MIVHFTFCFLQKDGTYMFNLEGFIPKLCQLAQEVGEDERVEPLRSAGLQALSSMVLSLLPEIKLLLYIRIFFCVFFFIIIEFFLHYRFGSWVDIPIYHQSLTM